MEIRVVKKNRTQYISGVRGKRVLKNVDDVVGLIGYCFEKKVDRVLLYEKNFTKKFFDLKSGKAGAMLQKFRDYKIKVAAVLPEKLISKGSFGRMVAEENMGVYFHAFINKEDAEEWLITR